MEQGLTSSTLKRHDPFRSINRDSCSKLTLHHCCRPGEDVQGALDGGHLLPDDRFLRSPRRSRSVSVPSRSSVPGVPQDLSVPDKSKRRCSSNEDTRQVFATGRGSREKSVEARHTVAEVRSLGTEVELNCLGAFLAAEASTNKVKRGLKNVTLSVECGPLTRGPPLASFLTSTHPPSPRLRESPRTPLPATAFLQ